jgi:hypothetical protein
MMIAPPIPTTTPMIVFLDLVDSPELPELEEPLELRPGGPVELDDSDAEALLSNDERELPAAAVLVTVTFAWLPEDVLSMLVYVTGVIEMEDDVVDVDDGVLDEEDIEVELVVFC